MSMTIDEIAAVVNAAFPDAQSFGAALAMLDARMRVESAQGVQRLAQAQAASATQAANAAIQAAQAQAAQAQADFDALVAQMVAQG